MPGNAKPNRHEKLSIKKRERQRHKETRQRLRNVSIMQEKYRVFTVEELVPKLELAQARVNQMEKTLADVWSAWMEFVPHEPDCKLAPDVAGNVDATNPECDCGKKAIADSILAALEPPPEKVEPAETKLVEIKDDQGNVIASGELPVEIADKFNEVANKRNDPDYSFGPTLEHGRLGDPVPDGGAL